MTKRNPNNNGNIDDQKLIALLTKARKLIASGEYIFVCNALSAARLNVKDSLRELHYLHKWINQMLGRHGSLHLWIEWEVIPKSPTDYERYYSRAGKKMIRNTRVAWIDWMIDHIKRNPR